MSRALFVSILLMSAAAYAQDDDLPALPTGKPKVKAPPRAKPKVHPKAPVGDDDLPALPAAKGELIVKLLNPVKGAKLFVDDKEVGTLPLSPQAVTAGEHSVSVRRAGYATFTKKLSVVGNKANDVVINLEATSAVLTVSSDVV